MSKLHKHFPHKSIDTHKLGTPSTLHTEIDNLYQYADHKRTCSAKF